MNEIKLTQYSHSSGCGCKIAPQVLEEILRSDTISPVQNKLIVGNTTNDDAAVYDMGNGTGLISTTDFFMPIVDDAYDFGRIASANALSDVYAMGGDPTLALAILGWPVNKLPVELAKKVIEGARSICREAGIPLAGGHSIDTLEPMFGLSVNGIVELKNLKQNSTAKEGDLVYITKQLGVGILSTATKRNLLKDEHKGVAVEQMVKLNKFGTELAKIAGVTAMTDVTGFGLLGHLIEIAAGSGLSAELHYSKVPLIEGLAHYTTQMCVPDNTFKNWNAYENRTAGISAESLPTLCDPQTNGGLLFTISPSYKNEIETLMKTNGLSEFAQPIGLIKKKNIKTISII